MDGAHTTESVAACLNWFRSYIIQLQNTEKYLLFNCKETKRSSEMLQKIASKNRDIHFDKVFFTTTETFNGHTKISTNLQKHQLNLYSDYTKQPISKTDIKEKTFQSIEEAIRAIYNISEEKRKENKNVLVLALGSFYLVGSIFKYFIHEKEIDESVLDM